MKIIRVTAVLLALVSNPTNAEQDLKSISGLLIVLVNEVKECPIDESRIIKSLERNNGPLIISKDYKKAGEKVGFLSVRLSGFVMAESCVINVLYQVKVAVDIAHNGVRTEGAISNRSVIGLVDLNEVTDQLESLLFTWTNDLVEKSKGANR